MSVTLPRVSELFDLLHDGEIVASANAYAGLQSCGLVWCDAVIERVVITESGLRVAGTLPNDAESVAGLLACLPELRTAWMRIVAARLKEAGQRRDVGELCNAIETLGAASGRVRERLPHASLESTEFNNIEVELFGSGAEQPVNYPKLLRVLGQTAVVVERAGESVGKQLELKPVDPLEPKASWCAGRVLQIPKITSPSLPAWTAPHPQPPSPEYRGEGGQDYDRFRQAGSLSHVLDGGCGGLGDAEQLADDNDSKALMRWVLCRPWIMLLAQIVFTQEAWLAEQISGQLSLELSDDQLGNPYEPKRIDVVVVRVDGAEVLCGSLSELVFRVLQRLQVALVARPEDVARLDESLAPVVRRLLECKVWRFDPRGAGGGRPGYTIDDDFSTSCYRAFGSKHFYRAGSILTAAIRSAAEQWAADRQNKSGGFAGSTTLAFSGDRA